MTRGERWGGALVDILGETVSFGSSCLEIQYHTQLTTLYSYGVRRTEGPVVAAGGWTEGRLSCLAVDEGVATLPFLGQIHGRQSTAFWDKGYL